MKALFHVRATTRFEWPCIWWDCVSLIKYVHKCTTSSRLIDCYPLSMWFKADDAGIRHHRGYEPKTLTWDKTRNTLAHVQASDAASAPTVLLRNSPLQDWEKKRRWYVWVNSCAAQSLGSVISAFQLCPEVYLCNCSCSLNTGGHSAHCQLCSLRLSHKRGVRSASIFRNTSKRNNAKQLFLI